MASTLLQLAPFPWSIQANCITAIEAITMPLKWLFLYELASLIASSQVIRLEYPPFSTTKELIQISSKQKKKRARKSDHTQRVDVDSSQPTTES